MDKRRVVELTFIIQTQLYLRNEMLKQLEQFVWTLIGIVQTLKQPL